MKRIPLIAYLAGACPNIPKKELYSRVLCGEVMVNGERVRDPKRPVKGEEELSFERASYVSRGGLKLEHALELWRTDIEGKVFLDAGASSGGFTDCLLQHGAAMVHAVDVGYNQLDYILRRDERVHVMERTNIMELSPGDLDPQPDAAAADLSFRSLRRAAAHIVSLTKEKWLIALMKPQFEYGAVEAGGEDTASAGSGGSKESKRTYSASQKQRREFSGVLDDPNTTLEVLLSSIEDIKREGLSLTSIAASPISGRRGNREFLLLFEEGGTGEVECSWGMLEGMVKQSVKEAYED